MQNINRSVVIDALELAGLDEDALRDDYSGRGMYGEDCLAVVCGLGDLLAFATALGEQYGEARNWMSSVCSDSMGRSAVYYWPGVTVTS